VCAARTGAECAERSDTEERTNDCLHRGLCELSPDPVQQFFMGRRFVVSRPNRQMARMLHGELSPRADAGAVSGASTRQANESPVGLPLQALSNNLPRMPRWYLFLSAIVLPALAFACNDETIQEVDQSVCFSGKQWIGGKRGDPRMYPGRDCVGCHLDNDGPEMMFGGTVYPFVQAAYTDDAVAKFKQQQTGKDCFGLEGAKITVTGGDGQVFEVTTNEAGNFFVEGKATDLVKPFKAVLSYTDPVTGRVTEQPMGTGPNYGGCGRCHNPEAKPYKPDLEAGDSEDMAVSPAGAWIGVPGLNSDFFMSAPAQQ
ncbi:MAG TPA: hypothetical protein VG963_13470, partial [Polyangiaceae bacterium]|nr:hypothetical protein [Polyangiaceae bacterium]